MTRRQRLVLAYAVVEIDRYVKQLAHLRDAGVHVPQQACDLLEAERKATLKRWAGPEYRAQMEPTYIQEAAETVSASIDEVDRILAENRKEGP